MQQQPIRVVEACPCWLAQGLNEEAENLAELRRALHAEGATESARVRTLYKMHDDLVAKYKEHITKWNEQYARNVVELAKQRTIEPMQTSAWRAGDLAKLLQPPKKAKKRKVMQHHAEGGVAAPGADPQAVPSAPKRREKSKGAAK